MCSRIDVTHYFLCERKMFVNKIEEKINVNNLIYEIRGVQVMLDSDLAKLYGCANGTKDINKAVKRNIERFPGDFYFQLTSQEYNDLKFQNGTSSLNEHGGVRKLPYAFTEQGTAQLASVLRTQNAAVISVGIARAFVNMRHFIKDNSLVLENVLNINNRLESHEKRLINHEEKIEELFSKFETKGFKSKIFYNGQIYDAYSLLLDIMNKAKNELIIIDGYADKSVLDIIKNIKVPVKLLVKKRVNLKNEDIEKYKSEYDNLTVIYDKTYHDRFIIVDRKELYHCGTSINYVGSGGAFCINKIIDEDILNSILQKIEEICVGGICL